MKHFYFLLSLFIGLVVNAQTNLNFETGDFTGWMCVTGISNGDTAAAWGAGPGGYGYKKLQSWNNASVSVKYGIDLTQHNIVSSGLDLYGNFPKTHGGKRFSAMLGDSYHGFSTGEMAGNIKVSTIYNKFVVTEQNKFIEYYFAIVIQPGHAAAPHLAPFFEAKVVKANDSSTVIPCSYFRYSPSTPYGQVYPASSTSNFILDKKPIVYFPWNSRVVDLSNYVGDSVMLVFTASDCGESGHFAYAYVDAQAFSSVPVEYKNVCSPPVKLTTPATATSVGNNPVYSWSNGSTIPFVNVSTPGFYTVQSTGSSLYDNGCNQTKIYNVNIFKGNAADFTYTAAPPTSFSSFYDKSSSSAVSWHWDFGDGDSSLIQDPTHTYVNAGNYNVCLTVKDSSGCSDSSCAVLNINTTTGVNSITDEQIKIYPNPSRSGEFTVNMRYSGLKGYRVVNALGVLMAEEEGVIRSKISIDLSKYAAGVYYLHVIDSNGQSYSKKLIYTKEE